MKPASFRLILSAALAAVLVESAPGEVFILKGGGRVEGELLNPDQSPRASYVVKTASGAESVNLWADRNSHLISATSNFIGCDLWEVVNESDLWSALAKGQARWEELQRLPSVIAWNMRAMPSTLGPGKCVKAQVTLMGIATDAIYRITEERGEMPGEPSLNYKQGLIAEWVQNA